MATKFPKYDPNIAALATKQPLSAALTGTTASFTTELESKLSGVATGATANSNDATLLARANHTGSQAISTITGLEDALDAKGNVSASSSLTSGFIVIGDSSDSVSSSTIQVSGGNNLSLGSVNADELNISAIDWGTTIVPQENGGTGFSTIAEDQILIGGSDGSLDKVTLTAGENVSIDNSGGVLTISAGEGAGFPIGGLLAWPTADLGSKPDGFLEADGSEGTDDISADNTSAITWLQRANGIPPEFTSASISTDGETLTIVLSEAVTGTGTSGGGFALTSSTAEAITLGSVSGSGTDTLTAATSRVILDDEVITIAYAPGDYVDQIDLPLEAFSGESVTNNSTESGAFVYDTQQDFEGTGASPSGWTGGANWDYTTTVLAGTQSGLLDTQYSEFTYTYGADQGTLYGKFMMRPLDARSGNTYFFRILDSSNATVASMYWNINSRVEARHGTASDEATETIAQGVTRYYWWRFTPGTSGTFEVWHNTVDTKPTGDADKVATIPASTSGMSTGLPRKVQMRRDGTMQYVFDNFYLAQTEIV